MKYAKSSAKREAKAVTIRLDAALWAEAKAQAKREDRKLVAWLERAIRQALASAERRGKREEFAPGPIEAAAMDMQEQEWLRSHWREHVNQWVALDGGQMVAQAARAREALEKAREAGFDSPFLVHVTGPSQAPFAGWI